MCKITNWCPTLLQDVIQRLFKDPVIQQCRLRRGEDEVSKDDPAEGQTTQKSALQVYVTLRLHRTSDRFKLSVSL